MYGNLKFLKIALWVAAAATAYVPGLYERNFLNLPGYQVTQAKALHLDIGHRFNTPLEEEGSFENVYTKLLGADGSANIGIVLSAGWANLADFTVARYGFTKLYSFQTRFNFFHQRIDKKPLSLSVEANYGIRTQEGIKGRGTWGSNLILAREFFRQKLFLTAAGLYQHNTKTAADINPQGPADYTLALGGNLGIRMDRWTLGAEYIRPMYGYMREDITGLIVDNFSVGLKYRIYKHSFGFVISNHDFNNPGDMAAGAINHQTSKSNLRFGFNIIREMTGK